MNALTLSFVLNLGLVAAVLYVLLRMKQQGERISDLRGEAAYAKGADDARKELLGSIRYEREVMELRRSGLIRKETVLRVRERVVLGTLQIAQSEHEVVLNSEVNQDNIWKLVDQASQLVVSPATGAVARQIAPAVRQLLAAKT